LLQVGGQFSSKEFICKATSKATQNALWAFWGTFAVAISFLMLLMFNLSQFRTDSLFRSTPPIRAAYRRLGQAAVNFNDNFIPPRPTHKTMSDSRTSSVRPATLNN
jgi:hypothetical protein